MDISQFELIYAPLAPAPPLNAVTLIQGYFVELTNLEDEDIVFQLRFRTEEPSPFDASKSLAGNAQVIVTGANTFSGAQPTGGSGTYNSQRIRVAPNATVAITVTPSVFAGSSIDPTPIPTADFKVNGYMTLRVPTVTILVPVTFTNPITGQTTTIQVPRRTSQNGGEPVKAMVTTQKRTTYLDATGAVVDQTQSSYPLCSGQACVEIEPLSNIIQLDPTNGLIGTRLSPEKLLELEDVEMDGEALFEIMSALDPKTARLDEFNAALEAAKVPFQIAKTGK